MSKITPKKVKKYLRRENFKLVDYASIYTFTIMFILMAFYSIALSLVSSVMSITIPSLTAKITLSALQIDEIMSYFVWISITVLIIMFVSLFFSKYFNERVWQYGKTDRNTGLFAVKFLVETSSKLQSIGSSIFVIFSLSLLFLFPTFANNFPHAYLAIIVYLVAAVSLLAACFIASWSILSLTKSHTDVTIRLLQWLKTFETNAKNSMGYLLLPKVIDYSEKEVIGECGCEQLDLHESFELLYFAKLWGNDKENQSVTDTIDKLISSLKQNNGRQFIEDLQKLKESNSELQRLNELKSSTNMSFLKQRKPVSLSFIFNLVCLVVGTIATIITALVSLGIRPF